MLPFSCKCFVSCVHKIVDKADFMSSVCNSVSVDKGNGVATMPNSIVIDKDKCVVVSNDSIEIKEADKSKFIGKRVNAQDEAFDLHNEYALHIGLSMRYDKLRTRESIKEVHAREFCYSKQGFERQ